MMELWYDDMVRFMMDASEYGNYNQELAKLLSPHLNHGMHICDAGCGLGYLSMALAPHVGAVTSVEQNPDAIAVLKSNCSKYGIKNILPRCGEITDLAPQKPYDAMVFCFFGWIYEILSVAKKQCRGSVYIITRTYTHHRFSVGEHKTGSYGHRLAHDVLTELGIPFEETLFPLEFGQPFRSMEDARKFFELYSKDEDKSVITDDFLRSKLTETKREDFPFYMPHQRNLALLKFDTKDIPTLKGEAL